ncbi:unnamed protein product [Nezara viridula]|uniref:Uncharacterized protein n=1 Tax=Nezara viridula TaxID=85310 RepID=A0A9P0HMY8_NEZVI|nr:unnamed protein product [Nezara viridula]
MSLSNTAVDYDFDDIKTLVVTALRQPSLPLKNKLYRIAKMKKKTVDPKLAALAQRYLEDIRRNAERRVDGSTWRFFNP